MTTIRHGIRTQRPPLSIEQRILRATKKAEAAAADAALAAGVAVAVDERVDDVLAGDEAFTGLNVGGTDVKPFLDKTDGDKLTDSAGLDSGVVLTDALATTAIRPGAPVTNAAVVNVPGLNAYGGSTSFPGAIEVLSASFTIAASQDVTIVMTAAFEVSNAETCEMALLIDDAGSKSMLDIRAMETTDPNRFRLLEVNDPGGDASTVALIVTTQALSAGAHVARLVALARLDSNEFTVPVGSATIEVYVR